MQRFFVVMIVLLAATLRLAAQTEAYQLVFAKEGDILVANADGSNVRVLADGVPLSMYGSQPEGSSYHNPHLSPDGAAVFFSSWHDNFVWWVPLKGGTPAPFYDAAQISAFGQTFAALKELVVVQETEGRFQLISYNQDGSPHTTHDLTFAGGCGGGPFLPDTFTLTLQSGFLGNRLLLHYVNTVDNPQTVFVSASCDSAGIQRIVLNVDAPAENSLWNPALKRPVISPDGRYVAGIYKEAVHVVDLKTGGLLIADSSLQGIDRLAWTPDLKLIVVTVQERPGLRVKPLDALLGDEILFGIQPDRVPLYQVELYRFNPVTASIEHLYTADRWRGIGDLAVMQDAVYFSAVDDLRGVINALNTGQSRENVLESLPRSTIYRLSFSSGSTPERLIEGESPVILMDN